MDWIHFDSKLSWGLRSQSLHDCVCLLTREISTLRDQLLSNTLSGVACVHMARLTPNKKVFQWALTSFFESMNVSVMLNNDSSYR